MENSETTHIQAKKANLHTHSRYCGHGIGELSQYLQSAKKQGLEMLGFSEHCPVPDGRWHRSRMQYSMLDTYIAECRTLQSEENGLIVLCGFECDHHSDYATWYKDHLLNQGRADYLAFGIHYLSTPDGKDTFMRKLPPSTKWLHTYTDRYIEGILSGTYLFGVHPDLFGMFYTSWDKEAIACSKHILEAASSVKFPLEINGYGCRKPKIPSSEGMRWQYPMRKFWELATQYDVPVIVNSDAHRPEDLALHNIGAFELADTLGIPLPGWNHHAKYGLSIAD